MNNFDDTLLDRLKYKSEFSVPRWEIYLGVAIVVSIVLGYLIYAKCTKSKDKNDKD